MTDVIRVNRTQSFKVLKKEKASQVGTDFELDSTYRNCYYLFEDDTTAEPRQVREDRFFLKNQKRMIFLMMLQTTDTKLIRKRRVKNERKDEISDVATIIE